MPPRRVLGRATKPEMAGFGGARLGTSRGAATRGQPGAPPPLAWGFPTGPRLVHLNRVHAADFVALGANHPRAKLVQNLKGRLVPAETELPLELDRRHTGREAGDEVRPPEPRRERSVGTLHDGANGQRRVALAHLAAEHARPALEAVGLALLAAVTGEALGP